MWLAPSEIYYSQDSISNRFGKSTEHSGELIGETLDDILSGEISIYDIDAIEVVYRDGDYISNNKFKEIDLNVNNSDN